MAVLEFINNFSWKPDVVHCNDWQTALFIPHIKIKSSLKKTATVYSIHNMGYLGLFYKEKITTTGYGWEMFTPERLEFWDQLSLAKAGLVFADVINTVSPTYAKEIQTKDFGYGLDGLLTSMSRDVFGILNGVDYDVWSPEKDPFIVKKYGIKSIPLKGENKKALQKSNGLPQKANIPLIGMTTRLADQKGLDILSGAMDRIMELGCQLIILGTGEQKYHEFLRNEQKKYPKQLSVNLGFDSALAQMIYAGSDMFLMPSLYEPCGLGQLISFKYGTVPIVRKTGGLADTVHNYELKAGRGDGFVFEEYSFDALFDAISRGVSVFKDKKYWKTIIEKIMCYDYSWETSAKKYMDLYRAAAKKL